MGLTILTVTDQIKRELESRGYKKVSKGVLVWQVRSSKSKVHLSV